jgi:hypothetical protein
VRRRKKRSEQVEDPMKAKVPSRQVLEEAIARSLKFLRAAGTTPAIAAQLATRGYDAAAHKTGWRCLHTVTGFEQPAPVLNVDPVVRDAIALIDAWDEPNFRIAHAALAINFPAQDAALFAGGLAPTVGVGAVLTVKTFLDRVDVLEGGSKLDKAAVARLAERGITKDERKRMRAALADAESAANVVAAGEAQPAPEDADISDLVALYAWYSEWSEVARTIIRRRDHLIALGLASRKKKGAAETAPTPAPAPTPTPPAAPPAPAAS